MLAERIIVER